MEIDPERLAEALYLAELRGLERGWEACANEAFLSGKDPDKKLIRRNPYKDVEGRK